jgi:hypothetical protein
MATIKGRQKYRLVRDPTARSRIMYLNLSPAVRPAKGERSMQVRRMASWAAALLLATAAVVGIAQSAQAAVPDRFGFALFSGGVVSEAIPATTTVSLGPPGRYAVRFPGQAAALGVVHVVAVHDAVASPSGRWCQADGWGPSGVDEIVKLSCYRPGGVLDPAPGFSVLFTSSSGAPVVPGLYGYVHATAAGAIVTQFNSAGGPDFVTHAGVGAYSVSFSGLGTPGPNDGSLQVTAVNPAVGARCKVAGWSSTPNGQFLRIFCFNPGGALADTSFTVSFQFKRSLYGPLFPPGKFGYLWNVPPLGPASTNFNSTGPLNSLFAGPPVWTAAFPNIAQSPGNVQVTAFGTTSDFCGLQTRWVASGTTLVARISCFTNAGAPINSGFFASYSSRF